MCRGCMVQIVCDSSRFPLFGAFKHHPLSHLEVICLDGGAMFEGDILEEPCCWVLLAD